MMRREKILSLSALFIVLTGLNACGIYESKSPIPDSSALTADEMNYSEANALVFQPSCVTCHSQSNHQGGVALDSYVGVKASLGLIQNELSGGTMPPSAPLPGDQVSLILAWIANGAPEDAIVSASPTATPSVPPHATPTPKPIVVATPTPNSSGLIATYTSIRQNIFVTKCLTCHSAGASESRYPLDTYASMMANGNLIKAGNPTGSSVYTAINGGSMPPRGYTAVTAAELAVIKAWIQNGAVH
jgi:mono/diheme cytochrome c family protein